MASRWVINGQVMDCEHWKWRPGESVRLFHGLIRTFDGCMSSLPVWAATAPLCPTQTPPQSLNDDVIKWKHFPRHWPFVRGIHRWSVNSPHKGQWREALMFSLICAWMNDWNNREAGDLRRHRAHYDVTVMCVRLSEYGSNSRSVLTFNTEGWTKWPTFCRYFQKHYHERTFYFVIQISMSFNWQNFSIGLDDPLNRWKVITCLRCLYIYPIDAIDQTSELFNVMDRWQIEFKVWPVCSIVIVFSNSVL